MTDRTEFLKELSVLSEKHGVVHRRLTHALGEEMTNKLRDLIERLYAAEREIERLQQLIGEIRDVETEHDAYKLRAEKAEAEVEKLRGLLRNLRRFIPQDRSIDAALRKHLDKR